MSDVAILLGVGDELIAGLGVPEVEDEMTRAREEYAERRGGAVYEDEELWESWTQTMLEWCAFERPWRGGPTPVASRLEGETDDERRAALEAWARSLRTIVVIEALSPGEVVVRDLIGGGVVAVDEPRTLHGVDVGDVAEVRLLGYAGAVRFGRTFFFHPAVAAAPIAERAAALPPTLAARVELVDQCAALRLRSERYKHVAVERIYAGE